MVGLGSEAALRRCGDISAGKRKPIDVDRPNTDIGHIAKRCIAASQNQPFVTNSVFGRCCMSTIF